MKTLFILLVSFQCFAQIDTIQPPCDLTRQQTRLWYKAIEDAHELQRDLSKYADKQHDREVDKQVKELKYGIRYEKIERRKELDLYKFREDSIKRSNKLLLTQERNRHQETEKFLKNLNKESERNHKIEKAKSRRLNIALWVVGIIGGLLLILLIVVRIKK